MEERELPAGWVETDLSEVCTKIVDGSHNPPKASLSGLPMLSARNVENREISLEADYRLIARDDFEVEDRRTQISNGDVLLTIVGAIGRTAVVPEQLLPFTLQRSVAVLKPNPGISSQYLAYALESPLSQKYLVDNAKGTAQKGIYLKTLGGLRLRVSPFNEQRRIAAKLDTTLAAVESCRQRLDGVAELLKRFRQAVLAAATSGELTREWREEANNNSPWQEKKLAELGEFGRGKSRHRPRNDPRLYGGDYPFIQTGDVANAKGDWLTSHSQTYSEFGLSQSKIWPRATLCITIAANIADTALLDYPACFPDSVVGFVADRRQVLPEYAKWMVDALAEALESFAPATAQKNINLGILDQIVFSVPPLDEQQEIVRRAQDLFTLADQLEARLHSARKVVDRLTPALLAKAFRGELVPQDPSDEPASALLERIRAARQAEAAAGKPSRRGRKQAAAHPDPTSLGLDSQPAALASDPVSPDPVPLDQLATLLQECGPLSEKALLAASELEPGRFIRQLRLELQAGTIREDLEEGERVLVGGG